MNVKDLPRSAFYSDVYSVSCSFYIQIEGRRYVPSSPEKPNEMCFQTVKKISQSIENKPRHDISVVADPSNGDAEWNLVVECKPDEQAPSAYNRALDAFLDAWKVNVETVCPVPFNF